MNLRTKYTVTKLKIFKVVQRFKEMDEINIEDLSWITTIMY